MQLKGEAEKFWLMNGWRRIVLIGLFFIAPFFCSGQTATNFWTFRLASYDNASSPAVALDGTIYVGNFTGELCALTPEGKVKWKYQTGLEIKSSPAVATDGTIYFGSRDRRLYALTPKGDLKWTFLTGAWIDSSPAIAADGTVYFGSWDTNFYALNPDGSLKWKFPSGDIINSSPAIGVDGTIYFGSHDRDFYALSPDGKLRWRFSTGGQITSSPALGGNGIVYFTSMDGNLYALNPNGTEQWRYHTGGVSESSPVVGATGDIYLIAYNSTDSHPDSFSPDGKRNWEWTSADVWNDTTPIALANGDAYFAWPWCTLVGIHPDHQISETIQEIGNVTGSPVMADNGTFYFVCGWDLVAIAPTNAASLAKSSWPMFRANPQHTGRVVGH